MIINMATAADVPNVNGIVFPRKVIEEALKKLNGKPIPVVDSLGNVLNEGRELQKSSIEADKIGEARNITLHDDGTLTAELVLLDGRMVDDGYHLASMLDAELDNGNTVTRASYICSEIRKVEIDELILDRMVCEIYGKLKEKIGVFLKKYDHTTNSIIYDNSSYDKRYELYVDHQYFNVRLSFYALMWYDGGPVTYRAHTNTICDLYESDCMEKCVNYMLRMAD